MFLSQTSYSECVDSFLLFGSIESLLMLVSVSQLTTRLIGRCRLPKEHYCSVLKRGLYTQTGCRLCVDSVDG